MTDLGFDTELAAIRQEQAKKRRIVWLGVGLVFLLGAGGITMGVMRMSASNQARIVGAWNEASACVVGDPVQGHVEAAATFRNGQLFVMSYPMEKRAEPGQEAWPKRCGKLLHAVAEALKSAGKESALEESSIALALALDDPESFSKDASERVMRVWEDAGKLGLEAQRVEGVRPMGVEKPWNQDALPDSARFLPEMIPLDALKTETTPSGRLMFVVDAKDQASIPALCTAEPEKKKIGCRKLADNLKKVSPGLELFGTSEESVAPFLFAGDRGMAGIFRSSDGKQVAQGLTYGASALQDGSLVRTVWNDERKEVWYAIHSPSGETMKETKLLTQAEVGNPYYNSGLFWDWLMYKRWEKDSIQLLAHKVKPGGELESIQQVGELRQRSMVVPGETRPHITACRTNQAFVVRVKGSYEQYTAFHLGDEWKPPVASMGTEGDLTCTDTEAVITHLVVQIPEPWVYQTRCTAATCQRKELSFRAMLRDVTHLKPQDPKHVAGAEVDGKLLVLWGAGERGGLRMRFAHVDHMDKAKDQVIFDDLIQDGKHVDVSTLLATRLLSGGKYAFLFLSTVKGVYVFHVDGEGTLSPATTEFL